MTPSDWVTSNNHYLAVSLQWLRARLQAMVRDEPTPAKAPTQQAPIATPRAQGLFDRLRGNAPTVAGTGTSIAVLTKKPVDPIESDRDEAAKIDPPPALIVLAQNFGLSDFERDTLLLCAAAELDPAISALYAAAQGNAARNYPTFALALQAFNEPSWDALSPHRPLRFLRLLEINQPGATPLTAAALRADERVVNYIKGLNVVDERLAALLEVPNRGEAPMLAPSQQAIADNIVARLRLSAAAGHIPCIELLGADGESKYDVATSVCAALERHLYRIGLDALPSQRVELENLGRLWQRERMMLPVALYVDAEELDGANHEQRGALPWFLSRDLGLVFVGLREPPARPIGASYAIEVRKPTAQEQRTAWIEALRPASVADVLHDAAVLAGQFDLNLRDIGRTSLLATHAQAPAPTADKAWEACCVLTRPRMDLLAQRIESKATWDDLVLPPEALGLLHQITAQVRGRYRVYEDWGYAKKMTRGLGISVLFAGESGTGKTMAAEVLANEIRLALYRIDLSAVVSKYIGESERNLRKLFDAAEQGGAILFFDEADALFGKRSEIKSSHDRYANIEINYLLQRMEAFSGLAILATNMKGALDQAFMRRLRFIVDFPFPSAAERKEIWQKALAPDVPRDALDYERLARFNLSGGNIHSIALNAAFAAAQRTNVDRTVTMPLLLSATRTELRKLEKQVNEAEFRAVQATKEVV